jgi:glutathionylspermidine synthase
MMLDHFKWDPQIGDESVLLEQPLILSSKTWVELAAAAERMAAEIASIEIELLERPELQTGLGLPVLLQRALRGSARAWPVAGVRVLRFDFHATTEGWRASEVNSDVPGGFTESSYFTAMMGKHYPGARPPGDPVQAWKRAVTSWRSGPRAGILYASGYPEDQQLVSFLGSVLEEEGWRVGFLQHPQQLCWRDGWACLDRHPLDMLVRFYQAEWLAELPTRSGWPHLFGPTETVVTNPGYSVLAESKRLPLIWERLSSPTPTLEGLFPQCLDPRDLDSGEEDWVFKAAFSNTGDDVVILALLDNEAQRRILRQIRRQSDKWVAQRRFVSLPVTTASGALLYPCIGVYTINGKSEGAYVRLSRGPVTDYRALEAALLVTDDLEDKP